MLLIAVTVQPVLAAGPARINTSKTGEMLRAKVVETGSTALESFQSAELALGEENSLGDWFLIQASGPIGQKASATPRPTPTSSVTQRSTVPPSGVGLLPTPGRPVKNPVTVGQMDLTFYMLLGAIFALIIFAALGLYLAVRAMLRER